MHLVKNCSQQGPREKCRGRYSSEVNRRWRYRIVNLETLYHTVTTCNNIPDKHVHTYIRHHFTVFKCGCDFSTVLLGKGS